MPIRIRDVQREDFSTILELNNHAGINILPLTESDIRHFYDHAPYFRVGLVDGEVAAFLIALDRNTPADGQNFQWFQQHFADNFIYIDRIVVSANHRGHGLGRSFYADITSFAELRAAHLCCEVFMEPPNDIAMLFHSMFGFQEVGQQVMDRAQRRVSLLSKDLCSYPYVKQTYLDHGGLPDLAWMPRARVHEHTIIATKECA